MVESHSQEPFQQLQLGLADDYVVSSSVEVQGQISKKLSSLFWKQSLSPVADKLYPVHSHPCCLLTGIAAEAP